MLPSRELILAVLISLFQDPFPTPEECSVLVMVNQDCRVELVNHILIVHGDRNDRFNSLSHSHYYFAHDELHCRNMTLENSSFTVIYSLPSRDNIYALSMSVHHYLRISLINPNVSVSVMTVYPNLYEGVLLYNLSPATQEPSRYFLE